jgi:hypothetical protein
MLNPMEVVRGIPVSEQGLCEGERVRQLHGEEISCTDVLIGLKKEELLRLLLAGRKLSECARILGRHVVTIRRFVRSSSFQAALREKDEALWARVDEELQVSKTSLIVRVSEASERALEKITELIESGDESIALRASSDILDRNPETSKRTTSSSTNMQFNIDAATLVLAARTAMEMENGRPLLEGTITSAEPS